MSGGLDILPAAPANPESKAQLESIGLRPREFNSDGVIHRCPTEDKPLKQNGAYLCYPNGGGWARNHRSGKEITWGPPGRQPVSAEERRAQAERLEAIKREREAGQACRYAEAASRASDILAKANPCREHPYLERKGVTPCPQLAVDMGGKLLVPVYGPDGKIQSLQTITPEGGKKFLVGGKMAGGYFVIKGREDGPLCICEGLSTGLSVHEAKGDTVLVAFNAGNLEAVARMARGKCLDRPITICGDDDHNTPGNPGRTKAMAAARAVGGKVALPALQGDDPGTDFNDHHQKEGLGAVRAQIEAAAEPDEEPAAEAGPLPNWPFKVDERGVFKKVESKDKETGDQKVSWIWVFSRLDVIAETRDSDGKSWGRLLAIKTREGQVNEWAMPMEMLAGDGTTYRAELLNLGLEISPARFARNALHEYISTARPPERARCVDRLGWHGRVFVLPDQAFGLSQGDRVLFQVGTMHDHPYRQAGRLEEWQQEIASYGQGNSRLAFAISAGFAAPLLHVIGAEGGGFHFRGSSSIGKTTILEAAGSTWGGGGVNGYCRNWRATSNGLEAVGQVHCDTLLCLDEMSQMGGREAGATAYMLANGQGKSRARRDGSGRPPAQWRLLFLSTGELSLAEKMSEVGSRARAGQEVRLVDIPADAEAELGIFEDLHGFDGPAALADHLRFAAGIYYGTAARAFLEGAASRLDGLAGEVRPAREEFVSKYCPDGADGQVRRVAARFGLVAAAGTLATAMGVLPWPDEEAEKAAAKCFRAWLDQRGGAGAAEIREGIAQVRAFFQAHGQSRFEPWKGAEDNKSIHNRSGFKRESNLGGTEFFVFPGVFRTEVCAGFDPRLIARELVRLGLLIPGSDGKPQSTHKPPATGKSARFYRFGPEILGQEADRD